MSSVSIHSNFSFGSPYVPNQRETSSSSSLSDSSSIASAYKRFQMLVGNYFSPKDGTKSPMNGSDVPTFPLLPSVHRRFAFRPLSPDDTIQTSHCVPLSDAAAMTQLDLPLYFPSAQIARYDKQHEFSRNFPPYLMEHSINRSHLISSQQTAHRLCMNCWGCIGTLFCDECMTFLCAPCAVVTHSEGTKSRHVITALGEHTEVCTLRCTAIKEREKGLRKDQAQKRRRLSMGSFSEAKESSNFLLNFRPLPNPDHDLSPMSKKVLHVAAIE